MIIATVAMLSSLALSTSSSSHIAHTLQSMSNLGSDGANFCQLVLIGLTAETSQELMLQSFPNCALIQYDRYDSNSTALTRGTTRSTRLVIVAAQGAFEPPVLGKQVESRIGSLLVLISERNLIKEFAVSFENIRVLNLVAIRGNQGDERQFNLFMSCEGSPEFRKIDVWQERNKQFLLGKDLETINGLCIKVLETKTLTSGKLGIVPYSFNDAGATQVRGAYMDAFRLMSQKFGFSLRFKASKGFGTINTTTGTWNGMMGQIQRGDLDMAMTFNRISKYRTMEISFMVFDTQMVYCTHPRKLVSNLVKALEPFSLSVWLGVFATLVAMSAFFIILNFAVSASDSLALTGQAGVEAVAHDTNHDAGSNHVRNGKQFATFIGLCLMPIALLVEQSHAWVSRFQGANAFRLGLGLYLFGAMVLTFSFKGNLLAALVFLDLEDPLLTSGDVLASDRDVYMTGPGALHNMLINLESPDIVGVMQRVVSRDTFLTPRQLNDIDRMLNNTRGVTIHHKVFGQTYGFETGTEVLFSGQQVIAFTRNFIWFPHFDKLILLFNAMGITNKILEDNKSLIPEAPKPKGAADDQVLVVMQLRHVWTPMVILVAGLIISTCVFVFLETGTKKNSNK